MSETLVPLLARLVRSEELSVEEIERGLGEILEGAVSDVQITAFVVALRTKGETVEELAALVRTMLRYSTPVTVAPGAIDTCGTGGDRSSSINISTIAAVIAAAAGARVVKHGNRAASSKCGSADVLESLGIPIELGPRGVERCVAEAGIGFCFAPRYHPALRFLGPVRRELGVPTTFNFLGPLANPARVTRQCVGVSDAAMAERVLAVLIRNGTERAAVFYGDDGLDELTTTTTSQVWELRDGVATHRVIDPVELGLERAAPVDLVGGDAAVNAHVVRNVLGGSGGPHRVIAVLNASMAIAVADLADNLSDSMAIACEVIDSGRATETLDRWRTVAVHAKAEEEDS